MNDSLAAKKCVPCEGGIKPYSTVAAKNQLAKLTGWHLTHDDKRVCKEWLVKDFIASMAFLERVAQVAQQEGHHPDIHLVEYRKVSIEIWTHAIGGLSENDFILAAKIDQLPVDLKH